MSRLDPADARLGIDFDNTLVCYDELFHAAARESGLIGPEVAVEKRAVRDAIRASRGDAAWTELQGVVYGSRIEQARPAPGALEFLAECRRQGVTVCIVSHKTLHPAAGPPLDLHEAARAWLERAGFGERLAIPRERWFFEPTRRQKLERIRGEGCTHFIDDLMEVFGETDFPPGVQKLLYDPAGDAPGAPGVHRFPDWEAIRRYLLSS